MENLRKSDFAMASENGFKRVGVVALVFLAGVAIYLLMFSGHAVHLNGSADAKPRSGRGHQPLFLAITCPHMPYFNHGSGLGAEWNMINAAFRELGVQANAIYANCEDANAYFEAGTVQAVWTIGGMPLPAQPYFPSTPLLARKFFVVSREDRNLTIRQQEDLAGLRVGIDQHVKEVLSPILKLSILESENLTVINNNLILASMLIEGDLDVLIGEGSVFKHYFDSLPEPVRNQRLTWVQILKPVYPRILFRNRELRDRFNRAWAAVSRAHVPQ